MIVLLITAFLGVTLFEAPGLIRKKYWRELITFIFFLSVAFILSILQIIDIKIPTLAKGIDYLFRDLLQLYY